ncbi:paralemmin 1a isoform X2 [Clupea harengus]|uniref:Paralemmin-1 n=1 Tax=Clupea harengus TaxID=7950 RepID=A0A6P8G5F5_CLUHA|nr:paralemmin 1a isoform X2 [Clupea harengus]
MEMSEALSQQERLQALAEKRKRQAEIENKKRQLEDDRRQLQHLKSKALRERWLLDGVPSGGPEEDEAKKQLQEDEAKLKALEETISRLEQELEELETGVSATSTKENLSDDAKEDSKTADIKVAAASVKAMYSVEITVERDRVTGETKVLSSNTRLPTDLHGVMVYEDANKVVHEVLEVDGVMVANGVHQLSSLEVEELILKADEANLSEDGVPKPAPTPDDASPTPVPCVEAGSSPQKEITGMETMAGGGPEAVAVGDVSADNPVTMVFMGYQSVEDEAETNKVLGLEGTVKAELVVIEDGEGKTPSSAAVAPTAHADAEQSKETVQEQTPPNGSTAEPIKTPQEKEGADNGGAEATGAELNNKEKQPCKCCVIM